jgi:hypothetical protein
MSSTDRFTYGLATCRLLREGLVGSADSSRRGRVGGLTDGAQWLAGHLWKSVAAEHPSDRTKDEALTSSLPCIG